MDARYKHKTRDKVLVRYPFIPQLNKPSRSPRHARAAGEGEGTWPAICRSAAAGAAAGPLAISAFGDRSEEDVRQCRCRTS